jgi:4-diphosphocytidyl-2-C-methyl-D-erythritol kinase
MVTVNSYAKINLALKVVGRRPDGFHDLCSVFQTVSLCDRLTFSPRKDGRIVLLCNDPSIPSDGSNLVVRAAESLRLWSQENSGKPGPAKGVTIRLFKRIPAGAGLGGGSSNAASALKTLTKLWNIKGLTNLVLGRLAAGIGSDVPFFLSGGTCLVTGRGEHVKRIKSIPRFHVVIVYPGFQVSTAWAYSRLNWALTKRSGYSKIMVRGFGSASGPDRISGLLCNDLEAPVVSRHRRIDEAKRELVEAGALGSLMSGSGSAVFGIFKDVVSARKAWGRLHAGWPGCYLVHSVPSI